MNLESRWKALKKKASPRPRAPPAEVSPEAPRAEALASAPPPALSLLSPPPPERAPRATPSPPQLSAGLWGGKAIEMRRLMRRVGDAAWRRFNTQSDAAKAFGVSPTDVSDLVRNVPQARLRGSFEARRVAAAVSEPPNAPDDDDAVPYPVDALVEAQWGGGADYYPAVVFAVGDDTVSLRYTDGDVEEGVPVNRVRPLPRRRSSAIPSQPAPRFAAKRPRATQPAPKTKKKPRTKKPPPKPPAPEPPAPKRRYDPEEPCAICLEPLGDAPQLPGCSHRLHAACVLGPDSLASHAWAENRPSLRRGQQVVCPVCRKTSWIPPGFL